MAEISGTIEASRQARGLPQRWYLVPTGVLVLGALSVALLIWISRIGERQRLTAEYVDALMDIQVKTAAFHLWLEEGLTTRSPEQMGRSVADLDSATRIAAALVEGGESEHGTPLSRIDDPQLLNEVERTRALLSRLGGIAMRRTRDPAAGGIDSSLDEQFDDTYEQVMRRVKNLELAAELQQGHDHTRSRRLVAVMIPLWVALIAASIGGVYGRELWRRRAELDLEGAYVEMEERVRIRTAELSVANDQLRSEIVERRSSEAFLLQSERDLRRLTLQFNTLLDAIPDSIALVSPDLRVLWANKGAAADSHQDVESFCYTRWHDAPAPCANCPVLRSFRTGKAEEARLTRADGTIWDLRAFPMPDEAGRIENVIEVATDVTEKLALQAETQRTAHLASIGELAAGVAHEINNPINGVINYARILVSESDAGSEIRDYAERIVKEGRRIAGIVQGLLSFARHSHVKEGRALVTIEDVLRDSITLIGSQMHTDGIRIRIDVPPGLPEIFANHQQIQQVFMNVLSNARHALNQKYPGADPDKVLEIVCTGAALGGNPAVRVAFRDRGVGIAPEILDRIMQPFFTTKAAGEGTGLGLSISHGIIADHGGRIGVRSRQGESTTVCIDLPTGGNHG